MHTPSGQCCVQLYARILSMSFSSVSIFSVCCYSIVSISMVTTYTSPARRPESVPTGGASVHCTLTAIYQEAHEDKKLLHRNLVAIRLHWLFRNTSRIKSGALICILTLNAETTLLQILKSESPLNWHKNHRRLWTKSRWFEWFQRWNSWRKSGQKS